LRRERAWAALARLIRGDATSSLGDSVPDMDIMSSKER
jgi:hypothetical protein